MRFWFPLPLALVVVASFAAAAPAARSDAPPAFTDILKIDAHAHVFEDLPAFTEMLRRNNARTINICVPGTDGLIPEMHRIAVGLYRQHPELYPFVTTFDLRHWQAPDFSDSAVAWLGEAFKDGAIGVKIWKEIGLELKHPDGRFLMADDPRFDPIYAFIARQGKTLVAHLAEPIDAWLPLDPSRPHYSYYSSNPKWHLYGKPFPPHAEIIAARDRILEKHPTLTVVGAHLGSLEHDLQGLGERLDRYPNFNVDCAGRLRNLSYQSSDKVRQFLVRYQDRVVYGIDMGWKPHRSGGRVSDALRQAYPRRIDARQRMDFDYLAGSGKVKYGDREVEALNLPRAVLEKIYHANATRLFRLPANSE